MSNLPLLSNGSKGRGAALLEIQDDTVADAALPGHGFLYQGGRYTTLDPPGSVDTFLVGINNTGQILGRYADAQHLGYNFLRSGGNYTILNVPGLAQAINDAGAIVGTYVTGTTVHGYLYSDGSLTILDVPGSMNTNPSGINDAGQIVGWYGDSSGAHGFLASPTVAPIPEPATLLLLAIGTLGVIGWVWWRR